MGNCLRSGRLHKIPKGTNYIVTVKTGDKKGAGTDANVKIVLINDKGKSSEEYKLDCRWRDDFEKGHIDDFPLKHLEDFGPISKIELWRDAHGLLDDWYVEWVKVEALQSCVTHIFPIHRWVPAKKRLRIKEYDSVLPQYDEDINQRNEEIMRKRQRYEFKQKVPGLPPQVKECPSDELFSNEYQWDLKKLKYGMFLHIKVKDATIGRFNTPEDIIPVYNKVLTKPRTVDSWRCDKAFGRQRVASCNPAVIRLCCSIPERPAVNDEMMKPFLEGLTLEEVVNAKRLFIVDYSIMKGLECTANRNMIAPSALFFLNSEKDLMPVAIQLDPEPVPDNPVFLPSDHEYTWLIAKMWFNHADANYHQPITHLGMTHLVMESIAVATHRHLSPSHPVFRLLAPHFLYLMAINSRALEILVSEGGWVDTSMQIGRIGMFNLIGRVRPNWRFDVSGMLPNDLKERGVDDPAVLPYYPYRDDGLLLFDAIAKYVSEFVEGYYQKDEDLLKDTEIQEWASILSKPESEGGSGIQGVPGNGQFETKDELKDTLTVAIFIGSVAHAAANFPQYEEYGFPANYPSLLLTERPKDKSPLSEMDIINALPNKKTCLETLLITRLLSTKGTKSLGDFEVQYMFDEIASRALKHFREELRKAGEIIDERNKEREYPYTYLHPKGIPNAISI